MNNHAKNSSNEFIISILDFKRKIRTWIGIRTSNLPVQVRILLLKSLILISQGTNYN